MFGSENQFPEGCNSDENIGDIDTNYRRSGNDLTGSPELSSSSSPINEINNGSSAIQRFILIIILRAGFLLIHIGSIPVTNINLILLQNIIDICWISIVYLFIGSMIAYTDDIGGLLGGGYWIDNDKINKEQIIFGWQGIIISSAIYTSCVAGRIHSIGTLIIGMFLSGIIQPFIIHWIWTNDGWMSKNKLFDKDVVFHDRGGSIVSTIGGVVGIIGCIILGKRIMRVDDIDDASMTTQSVTTNFLGYLFVVIGLQSLWISNSTGYNSELSDKQLYQVMMNIIISISACTIVVTGIHFFKNEPFNRWTVTRCVQGTVGGVVIISAAADLYSPTVALVIGTIGGLLFYFITKILFKSQLEDYCNAVTTHFICGFIGCLIVPFFNTTGDNFSYEFVAYNFIWQLLCLIVIIGVIVVIMIPVFLTLDHFGLLRNKPEVLNYLRSQEAQASQNIGPPRSIIKRFFFPNDETTLIQSGRLPNDVVSSNSV